MYAAKSCRTKRITVSGNTYIKPRTITIKGTGRADIKPDLIIIRLSVGSTDKNYEKASDAASEHVTALKAALTGAGFSEDALRTSDFGIM